MIAVGVEISRESTWQNPNSKNTSSTGNGAKDAVSAYTSAPKTSWNSMIPTKLWLPVLKTVSAVNSVNYGVLTWPSR
jgi:hypothetical protein